MTRQKALGQTEQEMRNGRERERVRVREDHLGQYVWHAERS